MHMCCIEQVWSYSLEFCPEGMYINKPRARWRAQFLSLWPECIPFVCVSYVSYVLCHFTRNLQKSPTLLSQNFPQFIVIHTVKSFGIVNKAEIDVFLELSCFFDDPADVGN